MQSLDQVPDCMVTSDEEEVKGQVYGYNSEFELLSDSQELGESSSADDAQAIVDAPVLPRWCEGAHDSGRGDAGHSVAKVDTGVLCLMEGADNAAACVDLLFTLVNSMAQGISQPI